MAARPDTAAGGKGFFKLRKKKKEETPGIICLGCEQRGRSGMRWSSASPARRFSSGCATCRRSPAIELSNQSKERALVGEVISTVALADQISREFNVSDQGIDMEIECNDDGHEATGAKLCLQLKSGDSLHAQAPERRRGNLHAQAAALRGILDGAGVPGAAGDSQFRG